MKTRVTEIECSKCKHYNAAPASDITWTPCAKHSAEKWDCRDFEPKITKKSAVDILEWECCADCGGLCMDDCDVKAALELLRADGWHNSGDPVAAGTYLVELENGDFRIAEWYKSFLPPHDMRWDRQLGVKRWKEIV